MDQVVRWTLNMLKIFWVSYFNNSPQLICKIIVWCSTLYDLQATGFVYKILMDKEWLINIRMFVVLITWGKRKQYKEMLH